MTCLALTNTCQWNAGARQDAPELWKAWELIHQPHGHMQLYSQTTSGITSQKSIFFVELGDSEDWNVQAAVNGAAGKEGAPVLCAAVNPFLLQPRWEDRPPKGPPDAAAAAAAAPQL